MSTASGPTGLGRGLAGHAKGACSSWESASAVYATADFEHCEGPGEVALSFFLLRLLQDARAKAVQS